MANELIFQEGTVPLTENLNMIKVGGRSSSLEISQRGSGCRVSGDLEVSGNILGNITDITFDDVTFDDISCATVTTTGTIASGGILTANAGVVVDNITIDGSEIDSSGSLTIDAATNIILDINDVDDEVLFKLNGATFMSCYENSGSYLKMYESDGGTDHFTIYCANHGATTIGTGDTAGQDANLLFDSDGHTTFQTFDYGGSLGTGKDITFKAGGDLVIDKNYSHTTGTTTKGLFIDLDRTGDVASGTDFVTGIDLDVNVTGASGGVITSGGLDVDVVGDAGGSSIAYGIDLDISEADICYGIRLDNKDGGTDFLNRSSANGADYFTLNTIAAGNTTLTTVDTSVGTTAHLNMVADGNFTVDAVGDISLDADGGNISLLDGGSTYTPTAASDATTKTYVDTRYFFSQTMTFGSLYTDHDGEWIICNNEAFFKLGGQDTSVDDTETATISQSNQAIAKTLWFVAPYDMTITHISGNVMDDDLTTHTNANFLGIWVVSSFGTSGNTPTAKTGSQTFTLKYITQDWFGAGFGEGDDTSYAFYDASPTLTFSAGDAVWVGHMNFRSSTADSSTVSMSIWGHST